MTIDSGKKGFERGLEPLKILGLRNSSGKREFLMMWKGCAEIDYVPASVAKVVCPMVVLNFYEHLMFGSKP